MALPVDHLDRRQEGAVPDDLLELQADEVQIDRSSSIGRRGEHHLGLLQGPLDVLQGAGGLVVGEFGKAGQHLLARRNGLGPEIEQEDGQYGGGQQTGLGYDVLVAASGVEALDILARDGDIDVLFTDVVMPGGLDGGEVAERAREIRPDIKILFQSGYFEGALVRKGSLAANNHLLVKPYRRKDLAQMMNMILAEEAGPPDALRLTRQ